jgi:nucleotide-binding universal stress UspA family protein
MEPTLPQEYQKEEVLQKQRKVHEKLIHVGMEKISLSYLRPLEDEFSSSSVGFTPLVKEGKNFEVLNELIPGEGGDLVVIGASGFNSHSPGYLGSVCLRVLRSNDGNFLVAKGGMNFKSPRFVVCLDGSASANYALGMALELGGRFNAEYHLLYVFDSRLHAEIFDRLKDSLIDKEGFSFNSKEQEKIHDAFIDKGLKKVGHMILENAEKAAFGERPPQPGADEWGLVGESGNHRPVKRVLEGYVYKRICEYAGEVNADAVFVGRNGRHSSGRRDLGSVAENVARYAPCSVFVTRHQEFKGWEL